MSPLLSQIYVFSLIFLGIVLAAELIAGRHRAIYSAADWKVNLNCIVLGSAIFRPLGGIIVALVCGWLMPQWRNALAGVPIFAAFLGVMLVTEFIFYWVHRLAHEGARPNSRLGWLWKFHRTHHSGKYMNVLLTFRMTFAWMLIQPQNWVYGISIYLGMGAGTAIVVGVIYSWNVLTHSHFRWDDAARRHPRFGPLFRAFEHIIISPGQHHTHHGFGKDGAPYRNYGVMIALYDWMFGTLHIPEGRPAKYGLPGPNAHWTEEVFYPLIRRGR